jgi:hydroxyacylglutathione hydrolase
METIIQEQNVITDRIFTPGLAQVAYLIADREAGEVAIIDPRRDVDAYVAWAEERGLRYVAIIETHVHADFVSGGPELALRTGAPIYASRKGEVEYDHIPVDDGDEIQVGEARLKALWSPGHTPEHMAFLLLPTPDHDTPVALYSGDVLFVGDVGRPDLLGKDATEDLGKQLFTTVTERLASLSGDVVVYPGHTAGSSCGKKIGDAPSTTIGAEKTGNYAFQTDGQDAFVQQVLEDMPTPPAYYPVLKKVNKTGALLLSLLPEPSAMSPDEVRAAIADGALAIDTRSSEAYGEGHIPGALFAGYGANFHAWMGWIAPNDRDLVIVGGDEGSIDETVTALQQIGIDRVAGYLEGGMDAWDGDCSTLPHVDVQSLSHNLADYDVLDVRNPDEWKDGHIEGANHLPAYEIIGGETPKDERRTKPLAVICGSGYRSSVASSVLMARGLRNVVNVTGGMSAWNDAGLPTTR